MEKTDVYHITVAGINPHRVAAEMQQEENPFYDKIGGEAVKQHILDEEGFFVGGIVETWGYEHLTPRQEAYLANHPHVIAVRHVWP